MINSFFKVISTNKTKIYINNAGKLKLFSVDKPSTLHQSNFKLTCTFKFQANETKGNSSQQMELLGLQRSIQKCIDSEVPVSQFVSDRHRGVAKWLREEHPAIKHYFDIWHIARTLTKKLIKAGNENNCQIINKWTATIRNHLYWCIIIIIKTRF